VNFIAHFIAHFIGNFVPTLCRERFRNLYRDKPVDGPTGLVLARIFIGQRAMRTTMRSA
jgi:hypothetical protein